MHDHDDSDGNGNNQIAFYGPTLPQQPVAPTPVQHPLPFFVHPPLIFSIQSFTQVHFSPRPVYLTHLPQPSP